MSNHKIHLLLLAASQSPVLPGDISLKKTAELYGEEEAQYLASFTNKEALSLRLQARSLLLYGLRESGMHDHGMGRKPVHLLRTRDGRPHLSWPDVSLSFSYADRALCLLGTRKDCQGEQTGELYIGADWEEKRSNFLPPASFLAWDMACTSEKDDEEYATRILSQWCRTEAVLKAAGCGLSIHPHNIEWTAQEKSQAGHAGLALIQNQRREELYTWQDVQLDNQHLCAVAVKGEYQSLSLEVRFVTETGCHFA